ncbi:hypothetical protein SAMN02799624_02507 [Paenibacillus sp. UNC496MF]|uniref:hypothetical protein n=1 Tax=Paenibacillus sp. UNC496MF TaxID=1502753 RepID=UPI0008E6E7B5|nr:hypothetical protein [Paenibacillus sp. UNC496MF]SFI88775.1 hypothetical protein SAMN02799624_02507 [Paenibacillus sp. UNC496MF]
MKRYTKPRILTISNLNFGTHIPSNSDFAKWCRTPPHDPFEAKLKKLLCRHIH